MIPLLVICGGHGGIRTCRAYLDLKGDGKNAMAVLIR